MPIFASVPADWPTLFGQPYLQRMWAQRFAMGQLQQLLPSQQAGLSQHVKAVAACADKERNRTARTASENDLNFMMISFLASC